MMIHMYYVDILKNHSKYPCLHNFFFHLQNFCLSLSLHVLLIFLVVSNFCVSRHISGFDFFFSFFLFFFINFYLFIYLYIYLIHLLSLNDFFLAIIPNFYYWNWQCILCVWHSFSKYSFKIFISHVIFGLVHKYQMHFSDFVHIDPLLTFSVIYLLWRIAQSENQNHC